MWAAQTPCDTARSSPDFTRTLYTRRLMGDPEIGRAEEIGRAGFSEK